MIPEGYDLQIRKTRYVNFKELENPFSIEHSNVERKPFKEIKKIAIRKYKSDPKYFTNRSLDSLARSAVNAPIDLEEIL